LLGIRIDLLVLILHPDGVCFDYRRWGAATLLLAGFIKLISIKHDVQLQDNRMLDIIDSVVEQVEVFSSETSVISIRALFINENRQH
jgi:hypothetical protein